MNEAKRKEILNQWLTEHKRLLFKITLSYTQNEQDHEDLLQEVALQRWQSIPSYQGRSAVSTWLYRVALNTAIRWSQKEKKRKTGKQEWVSENQYIEARDPLSERSQWLYEQISVFQPLDKSICLLLLEGYNHKEIGEMLGISQNHVAVKIHRVKDRLKKEIK
jgi:RNA polymerase sigma-70 factor (ECF subfamily)